MKVFIKNLFLIIFTLYIFLSIFIFLPYYNWKYASENGFVKWILLGEVVSTFKAVTFPYFFLGTASSNQPNKVTDTTMDKFYRSLELSQKATHLINNDSAYSNMSEEEMKKIIDFEKQALEVSKTFDAKYLDSKYNGLGQHYKNEFVEGLNLFVEGFENQDAEKSVKGQKLKDQWDDWYINNLKKINNVK